MIITKLKVNRSITADHWKQMAIGETDEYGNPFRIIKLRWLNNSLHKNTEYAKTRGFEDAIIHRAKNGNIGIKYRRNGSIMWQRPIGGVGPFMGEVAQTPQNMKLLASHYGDRLWRIMDEDIDAIVRKMYEENQKKAKPEITAFNQKRIAGMHTMALEAGEVKTPEIPLDADQLSVTEQNRLNQIKKAELDKRSIALDMKEKGITDKIVDMVGDGVAPVTYNEEYLQKEKFYNIRRICKQLGCEWTSEDKKDVLIQKILQKQAGNTAEVNKKLEGIIGEGLDD